MRKILFGIVFLLPSFLWGAEPVGKVIDFVGEAWITHPNEEAAIAFLNQEIHLGDTIKTTKTGAVKILFIDDTLLTVKENSLVLISEFLFDAKAKQRKVIFQATYGRLRTLVGKFFGKEQPVEVRTPTAVAGIRGTDLGVAAEMQSSTFYCFLCEEEVLSIYNIDFPDKTVSLNSGQSIQILKKRAALREDILPIPEDILDQKDILFDIQKAEAVDVKEEEGILSTEKLVIDEAETAKRQESVLDNPAGADRETAVNPGAKQENSPTVKLTITLPGS